MAISLSQMRESLLPKLEEAYDEVFNPGWAVYLERDDHTGVTTIERITPFPLRVDGIRATQIPGKHRYVIRVTECRDEVEAYMKTQKILKEQTNGHPDA